MRAPRGGLAAAGVALLGVLLTGCAPGADDPVGSVGDRPVTAAEVAFHAELLAPAMRSEVGTGAVAKADADRVLRDRAFESVVADEQLLVLGREQGLVPFDDFDGFLATVEEENRVRADAVARGEIVYGLTEFTPEQYWSRFLTNLRAALIEGLGATGGPLAVTDAEVVARFEADPAAWQAAAAITRVRTVDVPLNAATAGECGDAVAEAAIDRVLAACPDVRDATADIDGAVEQPNGSPAAEALAAVTDLGVGATAPAVVVGDRLALHQLVARDVDAAAALDTYRDRIRAVLVEERLDELLAQMAAEVPTEVDRSRIDAIPLEGQEGSQ